MDIRSKKDGNEEEIRPLPEIIEFCRIIAQVLRRTPQPSQVDVEGSDHIRDENVVSKCAQCAKQLGVPKD